MVAAAAAAAACTLPEWVWGKLATRLLLRSLEHVLDLLCQVLVYRYLRDLNDLSRVREACAQGFGLEHLPRKDLPRI